MEQLKPSVAEFTWQRDTGAAGTRQHLTSVSPRMSAHHSPPSCCVNVNVRGVGHETLARAGWVWDPRLGAKACLSVQW